MRVPLTGQHTHQYSHTYTQIFSHWHTLKTTAPYSHSHTYTFICSHTHAFSHPFTHTHIHSYILKCTHTLIYSTHFHTHLHTHTQTHMVMAFSGSKPNLSFIAWHSPRMLLHSSPGVPGPLPCQFSGLLCMHKPVPNKIRVPIVLSQPPHLYSWIRSISPPWQGGKFPLPRDLKKERLSFHSTWASSSSACPVNEGWHEFDLWQERGTTLHLSRRPRMPPWPIISTFLPQLWRTHNHRETNILCCQQAIWCPQRADLQMF